MPQHLMLGHFLLERLIRAVITFFSVYKHNGINRNGSF